MSASRQNRERLVWLVALVLLCLYAAGPSCSLFRGGEEAPLAPAKLPPALPELDEGVCLRPTRMEARPGDTLEVEIAFKPAAWTVSGCEVVLGYDPAVLVVVGVQPGGFLGSDPIVGLKRMDNSAGEVTLAMARRGETPSSCPAGVLATVSLSVRDSAPVGEYPLELTKVGLADASFQDIEGVPTQGATLYVVS